MPLMRWLLVMVMLLVAVSGSAQSPSNLSLEPQPGSPVVEPSLAPSPPADTAPGLIVLDDPGATIAESVGRARTGGKRILWDLTHGVYLSYQPSGRYSSLVSMLNAEGFTVATTAAGLENVDMSQYDILVLCLGSAWDTAYTAGEVDVVRDFVDAGGGLLIMGDNTGCPNSNLAPVATVFGTTLGAGPLDGTISNLSSHPVFTGISSLYLQAPGWITAAAPSLAVAWDSLDRTAVAAAGYGNGRMVAIGEFSVWENDYLANADNAQFGLNVFNWLSFSQKRVLWDLTHGVYSGYEPSTGYSSLITTLGAYGHEVTTTAAGLATVDLSQYDTLVLNVLNAWDSAYTAAEADLIADFVATGGGLVIMGDQIATPNANLNPVAEEFGTALGVGGLDSAISNFISHAVFDGVSSLTLPAGGQITAAAPSVLAAWDASDRGAVNVAEYYDGRMVATGDGDLWTNDYLTFVDNLRFATNVFEWVAPGPLENWAPSLSIGGFDPSDPAVYGPGTEFRFFVQYYDGDEDAPSVMRVYIDGVARTMSLASGAPSDGAYEFRTTLATGAHDYYFYAADGRGGTDRLPEVDRLPGPFICRQRINDNAVWTDTPNVNVRVWGKGAANVHLKNKLDIAWQGTFAYAPSSSASVVIPWTLAAGGDGLRPVYALCTTSHARPSNISADTIWLDTTTPPVIKSFFINNRAATTSTLDVTVKLFTDCAIEVRFKNTYAASWGAWQPMSTYNVAQFPWTLAAGADGSRAVYVQVRDHHGGLSTARCDTIELTTGG